MPTRNLICLLAGTVFLASFGPISTRPFFFAHDVVAAPEAVGEWQDGSGKFLSFGEAAEGYVATFAEGEESVSVEVKFFQFQGTLFAGLLLPKGRSHNVEPLHFVSRILVEGDCLSVSDFDRELLISALAAGDLSVPYEEDDLLLLTGSTAELQELLSWCIENACFERDVTKYSRVGGHCA